MLLMVKDGALVQTQRFTGHIFSNIQLVSINQLVMISIDACLQIKIDSEHYMYVREPVIYVLAEFVR